MTRFTVAHEWLLRYLKSQFVAVEYICNEDCTVTVVDHHGESTRFGLNLFADVLDLSTDPARIVAISDCPHDLETVGESEPTRWENNPDYFG